MDAADLIELNGWWRMMGMEVQMHAGTSGDTEFCHCAFTAFGCAFDDATTKGRDLLKQVIGQDTIIGWNDSQISAEPVIAALRKAGGL